MNCPDCGNALAERRMRGERLDLCGACRALWFDRGELATVINSLVNEVPEHDRLATERRPVERVPSGHRGACPRCATPLQQFNYAYDSNIFVARCPECGGVWIRRGQLRQLVRHLKGTPAERRMGESLARRTREKLEDADQLSGRMSAPIPVWGLFPVCILPVGDTAERRTFPAVTIGLIALNVLISLAVFWSGDRMGVFEPWGMIPAQALSWAHWHTLVTSMFLHVGVFHLGGNMLFLWIFGDNIEDRLGRWRYVGFYVVCGLAAGLAHMAANPSSTVPTVGASGAIAGVMGAYLLCYPWARVKIMVYYRIYAVPAWVYLAFWIGMQLFSAWLASGQASQGGVAWWAHIGGFACGLALAQLSKVVLSRNGPPVE